MHGKCVTQAFDGVAQLSREVNRLLEGGYKNLYWLYGDAAETLNAIDHIQQLHRKQGHELLAELERFPELTSVKFALIRFSRQLERALYEADAEVRKAC